MVVEKPNKDQQKCGIVMPISECDGCDEAHWQEVLVLIKRASQKAGFEGTLVSEADDVGVIQKRIVQNLYACPVAVCDISGRNANVMFELGMRLAFDKPTVIIKDDHTPFSFDTSPIEHVTYPRDLRFSKMELFQEQLSAKIEKSAKSTGDHSFLKSFGSFKVADISVEKAPVDELLLDEIAILKTEMRQIRHLMSNREGEQAFKKPDFFRTRSSKAPASHILRYDVGSETNKSKMVDVKKIMSLIEDVKGVDSTDLIFDGETTCLEVSFDRHIPNRYLAISKEKIIELLQDLI